MISSLELQSLVDAARETGESVAVTVLPDETVVEIRYQPKSDRSDRSDRSDESDSQQ